MPELVLVVGGALLAGSGLLVLAFCMGVEMERRAWGRGRGWRAAAAYQVTVRSHAERIVRAGRGDEGAPSGH